MKLLVIGGSDAGISAGLAAREVDPASEVTLLVADEYPNFSICGIPYHVSGEVPHWRDLAHRTVGDLDEAGLGLRLGHRVTGIDPTGHTVTIRTPDGGTATMTYDRLLIGTGATPVRPCADRPESFMTSSPNDLHRRRVGRHDGDRPWQPFGGRRLHMPDKSSVLFVCVHNAGRSQMAAGWLRHLAGDSVEVRSAGSEPADRINPVAVEAMREVGIDITTQTPRKLDYATAESSDVLVSMGCGDACPVFPGKRYLDWDLDDPAGQGIDAVRRIRDDIRGRVEKLVSELNVAQ